MIDTARSCINTPFIHQGRLAGVGLDCIGLLVHVVNKYGGKTSFPTDYSRFPDPARIRKELGLNGFVKCYEAVPGDILFMWYCGLKWPQHFGIWTGESIVHAFEPRSMVIESRINNFWKQRIVEVYKWPHLPLLS